MKYYVLVAKSVLVHTLHARDFSTLAPVSLKINHDNATTDKISWTRYGHIHNYYYYRKCHLSDMDNLIALVSSIIYPICTKQLPCIKLCIEICVGKLSFACARKW